MGKRISCEFGDRSGYLSPSDNGRSGNMFTVEPSKSVQLVWKTRVLLHILTASTAILVAACVPELKESTENKSGSSAGVAGQGNNGQQSSVTGGRSSGDGASAGSNQLGASGSSASTGVAASTAGGMTGSSAPTVTIGGATYESTPTSLAPSSGGSTTAGGTGPHVGGTTPVMIGVAGTATGGTTAVTTNTVPDTTPPELVTKAPTTTASPADIVQAKFSEPIDCSTATTASFQVKDASAAVTGTLTCSGDTVTFAPREGFTFTVSYSVSLTNGIKDQAGNSLKNAPQSWTFKGREGQWDSASTVIDSTATGTGPEVAVSLTGDATVVWYRSVGIVNNAWSSRFPESSGTWSGAIPLFTSSEDSFSDLRVGADDSGRFIAAWAQGVPGFTDMWDAVVSRIVPGDVWETPRVLSTDKTHSTIDAHLTVEGSGDASLVWLQHGLPFSSTGEVGPPWGSRFSANEGAWSTATQLHSPNCDGIAASGSPNGTVMTLCSADNSVLPITWATGQSPSTGTATGGISPKAIKADGSNNFIALWQDGNDPYSLWSNRWSAGTKTWGTAVQLRQFGFLEAGPSLAVNAKGAAVTAWVESLEGETLNRLVGAHVSGPATSWNWFIEISTGTAGSSTYLREPSVGIDAAGNAMAVWTRSGDGDGTVWASRFVANASSPAWTPPIRLSQNAAAGARVSMHPSGRALVVWTESEVAGSETSLIRAKWFR